MVKPIRKVVAANVKILSRLWLMWEWGSTEYIVVCLKAVLNNIVIGITQAQHKTQFSCFSNGLHPGCREAEFQPVFQNEFFPRNKSCLSLSTSITCCGVNSTPAQRDYWLGALPVHPIGWWWSCRLPILGRICNRDEWLHSSWSVMER